MDEEAILQRLKSLEPGYREYRRLLRKLDQERERIASQPTRDKKQWRKELPDGNRWKK